MERLAEARPEESSYTITLDQDPEVRNAIANATGLECRWYSGREKLDDIDSLDPVAVFIDVKLGIDAVSDQRLIQWFKDTWPLAPVIVTAKDEDAEFLTEAVAVGADDFVAKPIRAHETAQRLKVRSQALVQRASRETITVGDMTIDTMQRSVSTQRGQRFLSPTEVRLISELAKAGGTVVSREILKARCWPQEGVSDNALNRKLYEIRRRLKPLSDRVNIRTIYGVGFVMEQK